jgi:hypothetical protein
MVKLLRKEKPKTCEMYILDKKTKSPRRCTDEITFINKASGGFLCVNCANTLHRRYPSGLKLYDAKKYLRLWFK